MDPQERALLKLKFERYERTYEYVKQVHLNREYLPGSKRLLETSDSGTVRPMSGTKIAEANAAIGRGDVSYARSIVETLAQLDPANAALENLLKESFISPEKLAEVAGDFAENHSYYLRLQDEFNNLRLAEAKEQELAKQQPSTEEVKEEYLEARQGTVGQQEEQQALSQEESPSGQQSQPSPSHTPPMARRLPSAKEQYASYKEANKVQRSEQARKLWENRKKASFDKEEYGKYKEENKDERKKRAEDLWKRRHPGLLKRALTKSRFGPDALAAKAGKWVADKLGLTRAAKWLADKTGISRYAKAIADRTGITAANSAINSAKSWLGNVTGYTRANSFLNGLGNSFRSWAGSSTRGLLNTGFGAARSGLGNFMTGARMYGGQALGVGGGIGTGIYYAGSALAAIVASAAFWWVLLLASLLIFTWWWAGLMDQASNNGCAKPGVVEVLKTFKGGATEGAVKNGENIEYEVVLGYKIRCVRAFVDIEVTDALPANTTFVSASAKINRLATDPLPADPEQAEAEAQGSLQGNTVVWKLKSVLPERDIVLSLVVTPNEAANDSWVMNAANVNYTEFREVTSVSVSSAGANVPPTQDNCNGKYKLGNPLGNFGDPSCDFNEDLLYTQLQQIDPANAKYWFDVVIKCESSYVPNAWADHAVVGTPDAGGAWGLFQMGRGKNGQYDHGDVVWHSQVSNAINYNNNLANKWRYWACARDRW